MLPPKCYTCGKPLCLNELEWLKMQELWTSESLSEEEISNNKANLLNKMCIKKRCCRQLMITYVELSKIIIP